MHVAVDVGGGHDGGEPVEGRVVETVVVGEDLESAAAVAVLEFGAGGVEAVGLLVLGDVEDLVFGDVEDLGVEEPADPPGAGDASVLGRAG